MENVLVLIIDKTFFVNACGAWQGEITKLICIILKSGYLSTKWTEVGESGAPSTIFFYF